MRPPDVRRGAVVRAAVAEGARLCPLSSGRSLAGTTGGDACEMVVGPVRAGTGAAGGAPLNARMGARLPGWLMLREGAAAS